MVFQAQTELESRKKLDVVLRQITADRLSEEQRGIIENALGVRQQCTIRLCDSVGAFCRFANPNRTRDGQTVIRTLFGDYEQLTQQPTATLVQVGAPGSRENTVYIYLPPREENE